MDIKTRFIQFLKSKYPHWTIPEESISEQLLSETIIRLPRRILTQIQTEVSAYYHLRDWGAQHLLSQYLSMGLKVPTNEAVCTSFDFHLNLEDELKLIEINTNAAFLALGTELYQFRNVESGFTTDDIVKMFSHEAQLARKNLESVTIIDEEPEKQRLFFEFLLYQKIFEQFKIPCAIKNFSDVTEKDSFVYNRFTDFYLSDSRSKRLKELFNDGNLILSPNPYEYFLLGDKQRMLDWQVQTQVFPPKSLLKIYDLGKADKDQIWSERKKLFFKPKNSYGSKQAYKGASISHTTFNEFYGPTMIAQEYVQPQEVDVGGVKMKFDLRCYAYQGKLQLVIARLYQGQTTNLRTPGGGFTVVQFAD